MLTIKAVTHWSIGVRDLDESERFYRDLLGLDYKGRLGSSRMACFTVGPHNILLCETGSDTPVVEDPDANRPHHAFEVSPEDWEKGAHLLRERGVKLAGPVVYRDRGVFLGREMYFYDPSGNVLELRDPSWHAGMPTPTFEELTQAAV